jgi:hypothetical protein
MDLRTKGILAVALLCIAMYFGSSHNFILTIIFILPGMFLLASAKNDRLQMDATNKIRTIIGDMGYSSNDVERLTLKTVRVLKEEYAYKKSDTKPKDSGAPPELVAAGAAADVATGMMSLAFAASKWTYFTQSELAEAIQTAATLINVTPPQR